MKTFNDMFANKYSMIYSTRSWFSLLISKVQNEFLHLFVLVCISHKFTFLSKHAGQPKLIQDRTVGQSVLGWQNSLPLFQNGCQQSLVLSISGPLSSLGALPQEVAVWSCRTFPYGPHKELKVDEKRQTTRARML